jgi:hypothetical protein
MYDFGNNIEDQSLNKLKARTITFWKIEMDQSTYDLIGLLDEKTIIIIWFISENYEKI